MSIETLKSAIQAVADEVGLEIGLSVLQVETGEQFDINGTQPFPMASVFKIPVLVTAGQQWQAGKFSLDDRITMSEESKSTGSGILAFFQPGVAPTVRDLLTLMIIISDNTATDMSVELVGGPLAVESAMHALGLTDIFVKMDCKNLLKPLAPAELHDQPIEAIKAWWTNNDILRDGVTFSLESDNNISSANSMSQLVYRLFQGELADEATTAELMRILYTQQLNQRLPKLLPQGVEFAHKTGTIGGYYNDSGVMTVKEDHHVVVTLFTHWDDAAYWQKPVERVSKSFEVEMAMGKIGRLIYDHYANV